MMHSVARRQTCISPLPRTDLSPLSPVVTVPLVFASYRQVWQTEVAEFLEDSQLQADKSSEIGALVG
jgi:hypothetical protein